MKALVRRFRPACVMLSTALTSLCFESALGAQSQRPLGIVDLLSVPQVADPQLSPDGRDLAFTQSVADWQSGRRITHIWRDSVDGGEPIQLTNGSDGETSPRWSPDRESIAFVARRGEDGLAQIHLLRVAGGEARQLTTHATAVSDIAWTPDGNGILFRAADAKTPAETAKDRVRDDVYGYEENFKHTHLWKVAVEEGTEAQVTRGEFSVTVYQLSDDGTKIVYHRAPSPLLGDGFLGEIWVANADGSGAVQITSNGVPELGASLSPDNSQVLFISGSNEKFETYYNGRLFIASVTGKSTRVIAGEREPLDVDSAIWSGDGSRSTFSRTWASTKSCSSSL